jgi:Domain of unknown function (DUF4129)
MSPRSRNLLRMCLILSLLWAGNNSHAQTPAETNSLSIAEYTAELDRLVSETSRLVNAGDASPLIRSIPIAWHVQGNSSQVFAVSSEWLRSDLGDWQKKPKSKILEQIIFRLQNLRAEAASFETPGNDSSSAHMELDRILAAPEFQDVGKTTWWDRLKREIKDWIFHLFLRVFSSSSIPTISNIMVYGLIMLAVALLGYWMYKTIRDNSGVETVLPGTLPVSSKEWGVWMAEARAAANAGRWRDAIHLAYWSGISYLEAQDMWPPDRARTPREYLRLLPATSRFQPDLRALTRSFEVVWYGSQPADDQAFSETIAHLERLGCRYN